MFQLNLPKVSHNPPVFLVVEHCILICEREYIKMWTDPELSSNIFSNVEVDFRERYISYLRTMKQRIYDTYLGFNELDDERKMVNQQVVRTPGRRGEIIKNEEIDKEFSRRYIEYKKVMNYSD